MVIIGFATVAVVQKAHRLLVSTKPKYLSQTFAEGESNE